MGMTILNVAFQIVANHVKVKYMEGWIWMIVTGKLYIRFIKKRASRRLDKPCIFHSQPNKTDQTN